MRLIFLRYSELFVGNVWRVIAMEGRGNLTRIRSVQCLHASQAISITQSIDQGCRHRASLVSFSGLYHREMPALSAPFQKENNTLPYL